MSTGSTEQPPVLLVFDPVYTDAPEPSATDVSKHNREPTHFGLMEASLVDLGAALGVISGCADLQALLTALDARVSLLETVRRAVASFRLEAEITSLTVFGSATLNAAMRKAQAGSFTMDATRRAMGSGSFTQDAILRAAMAGSASLDAYLLAGGQGVLHLDAIFRTSAFGSFPVEAVLRTGGTGSLVLDANLRRLVAATAALDAVIFGTSLGSFALDAVLHAFGGTLTLDATFRANIIIRPASDAATSGTVTRSSGSVNFSLINETPNNNATFITIGSAAGWAAVQCTDPVLTGFTIEKVVVDWRGTNSAPSGTARICVRNPATGSVYDSSGTIPQGTTTLTETWTTRPWDSQPWTAADVAQLQIGPKAGASGPFNNKTGSMWATVYYY